MSPKSAGLAVTYGYNNVRVYLEGEPAWAARGFPLYASNDFIISGNIVLLDIRSAGKAVAGRIPRALAIPYEELENRLDDIPRNAPVVLYSDDRGEVMAAYADLKDDGFKFVSLVEGNFQGWVDGDGKIEKGAIFSTEITWQRILGKGEVSVAEFKAATEGEIPNVMIIDARTEEEIAQLGIFKNTVNIPLDEIPSIIDTLPRDKKIFVHCATGARADLAYKQLKEAGIDARFLLLNISDAECDCVIIRP